MAESGCLKNISVSNIEVSQDVIIDGNLTIDGTITGAVSGNLTGTVTGDLTIYDDNNNADTSLSLGTGANEALVIQVLNGADNKTAESVSFTSKTASDTADHGKMTFSVDESEKLEINDSGISVTGNAVVSGDLTVNGTTTSLQTTNSVVKDTIFELNNGATGANANDIGIVMERGTAGNNAFIGWDESADQFVVATTTATGESSGDLALDDANFRAANIDATGGVDVTGTLSLNGTALTSTAAELNIMDGDTAATATTIADADRLVLNDNGTMVQVAVTDLDTYISASTKTLTNKTINSESNTLTLDLSEGTLTGTTAEFNTALSDGSFATLAGSETLTNKTLTSPKMNSIEFEGATADDFETTLGVVDPTADRTVNIANASGTLIPFAAASTTTIEATPTELNIMDGDTDATATTIADADRLVLNDDGTMVQVAVTDLDTYISATTKTLTNKTLTSPKMNSIEFEGATADDFETTLGVVDPTADRTVNIANASGTLIPFAAASTTTIEATPTELNIMDGDTDATATTIADADRLVLNDDGTMVQVAVTDLDTYISASTKTLTNKTLTSPIINAATFSGILNGAIIGGVNAASGGGESVALSLTTLISEITTTGSQAFSLANGTVGQVKIITMVADGGDATLTPATLSGSGSTITFNDVGDSVILVYHNSIGWTVIMNNGTTIA